MKRFFQMLLIVVAMVMAVSFSSCKSCSTEKPIIPADTTIVIADELNVDSLMIADYDYIASQYKTFHFYEADIHFDKTIDNEDATVDGLRTIFQVEDTCIAFEHYVDCTDTLMVIGHWAGCSDLNSRVPVSFDSCMTIVNDIRGDLKTQFVTFRRILAPPFPKHGWWIFSNGKYAIDSYSGESVIMPELEDNLNLGCPLGEWP